MIESNMDVIRCLIQKPSQFFCFEIYLIIYLRDSLELIGVIFIQLGYLISNQKTVFPFRLALIGVVLFFVPHFSAYQPYPSEASRI